MMVGAAPPLLPTGDHSNYHGGGGSGSTTATCPADDIETGDGTGSEPATESTEPAAAAPCSSPASLHVVTLVAAIVL